MLALHTTTLGPHLSEKGRIWVEVLVGDHELYQRPMSQGGTWVLAQRMKIIKELKDEEVSIIIAANSSTIL